MKKIILSLFVAVIVVCSTSFTYGMQTFRFPLHEFEGPKKLPYHNVIIRQIGAFRNISTMRIEISGSASYSEKSTSPSQMETAAVRPEAFIQIRGCTGHNDQLEPFARIQLTPQVFNVSHPFIKHRERGPFLVDGDGSVTVSMNLYANMMDRHHGEAVPAKEPTVTIQEATLVVEAEERTDYRKSDPFRLPIVFSGEAVNHAWGYIDEGFIVDADGKVFRYNNVCRGPLYLTEEEPLTDEMIRKRFTMTKYVRSLNPREFSKMKSLLASAAKGKMTRMRRTYDAGARSLIAFMPDETNTTYKEVDIASTGDYDIINNSPAGGTLQTWLSSLWQETFGFPWAIFEETGNEDDDVKEAQEHLR